VNNSEREPAGAPRGAPPAGDQRRLTEQLEATDLRFRTLVDVMDDAVALVRDPMHVVFANPSARALRRQLQTAGVVQTGQWPMLSTSFHGRLGGAVERCLSGGDRSSFEEHIELPHGAIWLAVTVIPGGVVDGHAHALVVVRDTTEYRQREHVLEHRATHDDLTGLPNRAAFNRALDDATSRIGGDRRSVCVLCIDLDNFKAINDSLGHETGDRVLVAAAERFRNRLRGSDLVARLGGDEFAVLAADIDGAQAVRLGDALRAEFAEPLDIDGLRIQLRVSVGVAASSERTPHPDLLRWADVALYRAKVDGRDRTVWVDEQLERDTVTRMELGRRLRDPLVLEQEVQVHFQPEVELATGRIVGAEALVRWDHPAHGLLAPDRFVPVAEEEGSIVELGEHVLRRAASTAVGWIDDGLVDDDFVLRVNFAARQLEEPNMLERIARALEGTGLPPGRLCLEVTETAVLRDLAECAARLGELRRWGVRVALDDFGTGYSSLQVLKELPLDDVKIDREFVAGLPRDHADVAIVTSVALLANATGIGMVAEGIESVDQADLLSSLGCVTGQGYLYSPPVPTPEFEDVLRRGLVAAVH
jgi:diguanylate cyclase (GGDEF)-like protein